jgi:hypothetical protein
MRETINRLSQQIVSMGGGQPQPPQPGQPSVDLDISNFPILPEGVDFEDVVNDKAAFENFMRGLLGRFNTHRIRQDALSIPLVVSRQVHGILGLQETVRSFYDMNKDLVPFKPLVGAYSNKIVAEHPDWNIAQVLEESAKQARSAVGTGMAKAPAPAVKAPVKPSFAKSTTSSRKLAPTTNQSKLAKDVSDLIADF